MKYRIIKSAIVIAALSLAFWACNKEDVANPSTPNSSSVNYENDLLKFDSYTDYENLLDQLNVSEEPEKFIKSFKDEHQITNFDSQESLPDSLRDSFLETILNSKGIVQIGDHLYKVDLVKEKVYVMNVSFIDKYSDLVNGNTGNVNIKEFSTGDDVVYLVEGIDDGVSRGCGGVGGGEYFSNYEYLAHQGNYSISIRASVKFFRAGIYFSLKGTVKLHPNEAQAHLSGNFMTALQVKGPEGWYKRKPCRSRDVGTTTPRYVLTWSNGGDRQWRFYSGTRNLNGYYFFVRAKGAVIDDNGNWIRTTYSSWAGRNISSPY